MSLFPDEWGQGGEEVDNTEIVTTVLYFDKDQLKEFKALAKKGIKTEFGAEFIQKGNLTDFLLIALNKLYGS